MESIRVQIQFELIQQHLDAFWKGGAIEHIGALAAISSDQLVCERETHFLLLRQFRPSLFLLSLIPSLSLSLCLSLSFSSLLTSLPLLSLSLFLCLFFFSLHHCIRTLYFPSHALYNSHSPSPWICSGYLCFKSHSRMGKTCALELGVLLKLEAPAKDQ